MFWKKIRLEVNMHIKCSQFLFPLGNFEIKIINKKENKKFIAKSNKNIGFS